MNGLPSSAVKVKMLVLVAGMFLLAGGCTETVKSYSICNKLQEFLCSF